jgi:hypothetical protein
MNSRSVAARCDCDSVVLSVKDEGIGLVGEERMRLCQHPERRPVIVANSPI